MLETMRVTKSDWAAEQHHNLISGSFAFSKNSLNIWKFTVHILLKPGLENFEHYFTSVCSSPPRCEGDSLSLMPLRTLPTAL